MTATATVIAHPNIALVKYWGKRDLALNLPAVSSVSLTLDGFQTTTRVDWGADRDALTLDGAPAQPKEAAKVFALLDRLDADRPPCAVTTANTFPTGAGLASSASGFAALTLAAATARARARGEPDAPDLLALSRLARQGSGSACRSLWGGFVLWSRGESPDGHDSHGVPLFSEDHWDVVMVVGVVSKAGKAVGSTEGMERSRATSPLYATWVEQAEADVAAGIAAIAARDLTRLGEVMEASTLKMHAAMMTARPPLLYWQPATVAALHAVWGLRAAGTSAWVTMDAGPQVKVLCAREDAERVSDALRPHVLAVHVLRPGGPARVVADTP